MRTVYKTLLKLREQEKRERHMRFAEAEAQRMQQEKELGYLQQQLIRARHEEASTIGAQIVHDHLNMQRHLDIEKKEKDLVKQTKQVEHLRSEMKQAQIECKVMEKVISSLADAEKKELDRKLNIINDEVAVMAHRHEDHVHTCG